MLKQCMTPPLELDAIFLLTLGIRTPAELGLVPVPAPPSKKLQDFIWPWYRGCTIILHCSKADLEGDLLLVSLACSLMCTS